MSDFILFITSKNIIASAIVIALSGVLLALVKKIIKKLCRMFVKDPSYALSSKINSLSKTIRYIILILTALLVLQINGVNVSSLIASLGIAGVVVGLALQDALKDIIMGTNLSQEGFFKIGDIVEYGGVEGTVISFDLKTTKIKKLADDSIVTVCNRNISQVTVCGPKVAVNIPAPYEADVDKVESVIEGICYNFRRETGVKSCEYLGISEFASSAVMHLIVFTCEPKDRYSLKRKCNYQIITGLAKAGISIPYNKIEVIQ